MTPTTKCLFVSFVCLGVGPILRRHDANYQMFVCYYQMFVCLFVCYVCRDRGKNGLLGYASYKRNDVSNEWAGGGGCNLQNLISE